MFEIFALLVLMAVGSVVFGALALFLFLARGLFKLIGPVLGVFVFLIIGIPLLAAGGVALIVGLPVIAVSGIAFLVVATVIGVLMWCTFSLVFGFC